MPTNPKKWIPLHAESVLRYEGSLTTEPFSETVSWVVLRQELSIASEQFEQIFRTGKKATTVSPKIQKARVFPKIMVADEFSRYVVDRNRVTGGGISSGLDEALAMISIIAGEDIAKQVQLTTQYFPNPPFSGIILLPTACPVDMTGIGRQ